MNTDKYRERVRQAWRDCQAMSSYEQQENVLVEAIMEIVSEAEREVWQRVALETRANICECGERWIDTDLGKMAEQQLNKSSKEG